MMMKKRLFWSALGSLTAVAIGCDGGSSTTTAPETIFLAQAGSTVAYELATGAARPGKIENVVTPVDIQALADGFLLVNLTDLGQVLVVDGKLMQERARIATNTQGGSRPVHSYISPDKKYWLALNDGNAGMGDSAVFVDIAADSAKRFTQVGEVTLGVGHHKAAFSSTKQRVAISNISDCNKVVQVFDYTNPSSITELASFSAADAGFDGSDRAHTCDPTFQKGITVAPHGCVTSAASRKAYCNLTGPGIIVAIGIDASPPTFTFLKTKGSGSGYTSASNGGRYVYSLQAMPREGDMQKLGAPCQIGQLVTVDTSNDSVAVETPLLYGGAGCTTALAGTDEATANPGKIITSQDGSRLFIASAGGFGDMKARVRKHMIVDISSPGQPKQLASVATGAGSGHVAASMSAKGLMITADNADNSVSVIDVLKGTLVRTIKTSVTPLIAATWGTEEGPGYQVGPIH